MGDHHTGLTRASALHRPLFASPATTALVPGHELPAQLPPGLPLALTIGGPLQSGSLLPLLCPPGAPPRLRRAAGCHVVDRLAGGVREPDDSEIWPLQQHRCVA